MMRRKLFGGFALTLWASTAVGALNLISVNDEVAIGRKAQQQVRQQVPELRDAAVNRYIDTLGRRIAAAADGPRYPTASTSRTNATPMRLRCQAARFGCIAA